VNSLGDEKNAEATAIVRWEAMPQRSVAGRLNRHDLFAMDIVGLFLGAKTIQVDALGDDFVAGVEAAPSHSARILGGQATEIAMKAGAQSIEAAHAATCRPWLARLMEIQRIESRAQKYLAIARLFEDYPPLAAQLAKVMEAIQVLRGLSGAQVEIETIERKDSSIDLSRPYFTPLEIDLSE
jgi:hypothetical protein